MTTRRRRSLIPSLVMIVFLVQLSPALAAGAHGHRDHDRGAVVTFTKWVTVVVPPVPADATASRFLMAGIVGGDVAGTFAGEVIDRRVSTSGTITAQIVALDAIYEVRAGDHSFTALIHGGQNSVTRTGLLDGVILDGWRTGARVHVEYEVISSCPGKPAGPCFQGTIRILSDRDED